MTCYLKKFNTIVKYIVEKSTMYFFIMGGK